MDVVRRRPLFEEDALAMSDEVGKAKHFGSFLLESNPQSCLRSKQKVREASIGSIEPSTSFITSMATRLLTAALLSALVRLSS